MNGLSYTFSPDGWKISYGDMTFSLDSKQAQWVVPGRIGNILHNAARDGLTESDDSHYTGNADGINYSMDIDSRTGEIEKIISDGIEIVFE